MKNLAHISQICIRVGEGGQFLPAKEISTFAINCWRIMPHASAALFAEPEQKELPPLSLSLSLSLFLPPLSFFLSPFSLDPFFADVHLALRIAWRRARPTPEYAGGTIPRGNLRFYRKFIREGSARERGNWIKFVPIARRRMSGCDSATSRREIAGENN